MQKCKFELRHLNIFLNATAIGIYISRWLQDAQNQHNDTKLFALKCNVGCWNIQNISTSMVWCLFSGSGKAPLHFTEIEVIIKQVWIHKKNLLVYIVNQIVSQKTVLKQVLSILGANGTKQSDKWIYDNLPHFFFSETCNIFNSIHIQSKIG